MSTETITRKPVPTTITVNGLDRPIYAASPLRGEAYCVIADISETNDLHPFAVWTAFWSPDREVWAVERGDYCHDFAEALEVWEDRK